MLSGSFSDMEIYISCADPERGAGVRTPLPPHTHAYTHARKLQAIVFLINTGPDFMGNHKATKPAFNVGSPSALERNAI